jgi:hypothetical protein
MKRQNKSAWIIGFSLLLAGFAGIPAALIATKPPATDTDNCRRDGSLPAHTVVLVDQSDPFDETDVNWAWQLMFEEAKMLKKHGRLTIMGIDAENPDYGKEVFSRCSPGSPSRANPIFENPRFIEQDWELKFEDQMRGRISELMLTDQAPRSPLAEHIKGILRRSDFRPSMEHRRILIISDMYQHSDAFSMYNSGLNKEAMIKAMSAMEFPPLNGAEIAIFRVDRKGQLKGQDINEFWKSVLGQSGAANVEVIRD